MSIIEQAKKVILKETEALHRMAKMLDFRFESAINFLRETVEQKRKIIVVGVGKSGDIGRKIVATFNSTGAPAVVLNSQNALHGDLGLVSDGDALIAMSHSGETSELLDLLPFIRRFEVKIIAMTGRPESTLGKLSDTTLDTSVEREACPLNLAPTSSSTAMLVMGDALAMVLLNSRGFTAEDFARYHPGGSLGRALLMRISDVMRHGREIANVGFEATVLDAIRAMHAARSGACMICDSSGGLAGIFTHGDFARSYENDPSLGSRPVAEFMTRNPVTAQASSLAAEAVKTIGQNRIDDIVVIDNDGHPVGMIDSQDLARLKLV